MTDSNSISKMAIIIIALIIAIPIFYMMVKAATENRCLKTQTNMIEIDGKKADYLICTNPSVYIIKKY